MRHGGFDRAVQQPVLNRLLGLRDGEPQRDQRRAQRLEGLRCCRQHALRLDIHAISIPLRIESDTQAFDRALGQSCVGRYGRLQCGRVQRVGARDGLQDHRDILHAASDGADVVQRRGQFHRAMPADAAPSRFDAGESRRGAGPANRSARVRRGCREAQAGRRRHGRSAGRDPSPVGRIPRIARRVDGGVMVGVRPFRHLQLPQQHRTRIAQAPNDRGVMIRKRALMEGHACGCWNADAPAQVFQCNGDAMQRATVSSGTDFRFGGLGLLPCRRCRDAGVAAQRTVPGLDA